MRHTQGPWEAVTDRMYHDNPYLVVGAGAGDAKSVEWMPLYVQVGGRTGWVEQKANTLLIAAAPDLLSALVEAVELIETISPMEGDTLRRARAAIAKAVQTKGKSEPTAPLLAQIRRPSFGRLE